MRSVWDKNVGLTFICAKTEKPILLCAEMLVERALASTETGTFASLKVCGFSQKGSSREMPMVNSFRDMSPPSDRHVQILCALRLDPDILIFRDFSLNDELILEWAVKSMECGVRVLVFVPGMESLPAAQEKIHSALQDFFGQDETKIITEFYDIMWVDSLP